MTTQEQVLFRTGLQRTAGGVFAPPALNAQGAVITADWILELVMKGKVFHAQQGDAGTLVDFAEVAYDEDQPQFALRIPTGKSVIPLSIVYNFQDQAGTDNHVILSVTTNDIGNGTSTALTISNMLVHADTGDTSGCQARSLYTANATAATGLFEFDRWVDPFAAGNARPNARYEWNIRQKAAIPVLKGPATLQAHIYATTDGPEGFGEIVFAALDTSDLNL